MPPSLYSSPRSRSYTNISHVTTKNTSKSDTTRDPSEKSENARTRTLPLPPKHKRRGNLPPLRRAPSQVTMHHTTVPQAMVPSTLGARHHPTKTSLRHSRLIVTKKRTNGLECGMELAITLLGVAQLVLGIALSLAAIVHLTIATWPVVLDWPLCTGPLVGYYNLYC